MQPLSGRSAFRVRSLRPTGQIVRSVDDAVRVQRVRIRLAVPAPLGTAPSTTLDDPDLLKVAIMRRTVRSLSPDSSAIVACDGKIAPMPARDDSEAYTRIAFRGTCRSRIIQFGTAAIPLPAHLLVPSGLLSAARFLCPLVPLGP